jgi:phosphoribosylformylglycinamidine synthase
LSRYRIEIRITPRPGLLDPEGKAIQHALTALGYAGTGEVRVGKLIEVDVQAENEEAALETGRLMCRRLLANPVTEDYDVRLKEQLAHAAASGGRA